MIQDPEVQAAPIVNSAQVAWDADVQAEIGQRVAALKTYAMTIAAAGSIAGPSSIEIQLCDSEGVPITSLVDYLRVRVCEAVGTDPDEWAASANATIAAAGGTSLLESPTANKDLVLKSDAAGLFEIELTNGTAETLTLRIGPPPLGGSWASYRGTLEVTHA